MDPKEEKILKEYKNKSEEILHKMRRILMRAQRKVDDKAYRQTMERLERIK